MTHLVKTRRRPSRAAQIAVLGLVWGTGVLALVFERSGTGPGRTPASARATAGATGR